MFKWIKRRRDRIKAFRKDVVENLRVLRILGEVDADHTFRFPMLGKEVCMYLPYAGFDLIQRAIVLKADFFEGDLLRHVRKTYFSGAPCHVLDIGGNIGNHAVFFFKIL